MIEGLVDGTLCSCPEQRVGKTGEYVTAKMRTINKGEPLSVNVIAFEETAQLMLLGLNDGAAVSFVGRLMPWVQVGRNGEARPAMGVVASLVLTPHQARRKHKALIADPELAEFPEDYEWLEGAAA